MTIKKNTRNRADLLTEIINAGDMRLLDQFSRVDDDTAGLILKAIQEGDSVSDAFTRVTSL